ncbi:hypothetical protein, partial [Arachidicoccus sp.]|uniref:hypothetical protein n=1 Tax=Arachidicoccus sp. TaxID=1872624 RepID=UPI003D1EF301
KNRKQLKYFGCFFYKKIMEELLKKLIEEAKLSNEQAEKSIEVVKDFVKEKFPMLGNAVDQIFGKKG